MNVLDKCYELPVNNDKNYYYQYTFFIQVKNIGIETTGPYKKHLK
jgi:hypothetical protein